MNENLRNFLGFAFIYGIPFIAFLRWKYNKWLQEKEKTELEHEPESESESSTSMIPAEAEIVLGELTQLRTRQAETLAQIEDIQHGRNVNVDIRREFGQSTTLSQESILQALKLEDKTLSEQILQKSLEFSKIMKR